MAPSSFDYQLRRYLEHAQGESDVGAKRQFRLDVAQLRQHFLQHLRREGQRDPDWVEHIHREWSSELEDFARYIEMSGAPDVLEDTLTPQAYAAKVLDAALYCLEPGTPLVTRLELERVSAGFIRGRISAYCLETGFTRREPRGSVGVTALGRAFLRLRGKDALCWLLAAEVAQSQGNHDPWRASRNLLQRALEAPIVSGTYWSGSVLSKFPFSEETLDRLLNCNLLSTKARVSSKEIHIEAYYVPEDVAGIFRSVLDGGPWNTAISALLQDERALTAPLTARTATEATIEQTRMIAHEVRNALIPVRYNIDELLSEDEDLEQHRRARVELAKKGVVRVLDFVDQLVETSEIITEASTSFDVGRLLREVIGWVDGAEDVVLDLPPESLYVHAPRSLLLRALLDVVRNALHSATPPPPVRISVRRHDREVHVVVDDGGPGVPPELRARVFDDGFTTRPGGSGFGLAFLRRVVERELRGRVSCSEADLGGARFTISIPDSEAQT